MKKKSRIINLTNSSAIYQVFRLLPLSYVTTLQLLSHKFYDKLIPTYINTMPVIRVTKFYRFAYAKKNV